MYYPTGSVAHALHSTHDRGRVRKARRNRFATNHIAAPIIWILLFCAKSLFLAVRLNDQTPLASSSTHQERKRPQPLLTGAKYAERREYPSGHSALLLEAERSRGYQLGQYISVKQFTQWRARPLGHTASLPLPGGATSRSTSVSVQMDQRCGAV